MAAQDLKNLENAIMAKRYDPHVHIQDTFNAWTFARMLHWNNFPQPKLAAPDAKNDSVRLFWSDPQISLEFKTIDQVSTCIMTTRLNKFETSLEDDYWEGTLIKSFEFVTGLKRLS